jgi:hypothetical protein
MLPQVLHPFGIFAKLVWSPHSHRAQHREQRLLAR